METMAQSGDQCWPSAKRQAKTFFLPKSAENVPLAPLGKICQVAKKNFGVKLTEGKNDLLGDTGTPTRLTSWSGRSGPLLVGRGGVV